MRIPLVVTCHGYIRAHLAVEPPQIGPASRSKSLQIPYGPLSPAQKPAKVLQAVPIATQAVRRSGRAPGSKMLRARARLKGGRQCSSEKSIRVGPSRSGGTGETRSGDATLRGARNQTRLIRGRDLVLPTAGLPERSSTREGGYRWRDRTQVPVCGLDCARGP